MITSNTTPNITKIITSNFLYFVNTSWVTTRVHNTIPNGMKRFPIITRVSIGKLTVVISM